MNRIARAALPAALVLVTAQIAAADPIERSFFADRRAYEAGDVLTVVITEVAMVTARARTETGKAEGVGGSLLDASGDLDDVSIDFDTTFSGGGQIERSGRLLATLAVTVDRVEEHGNLVVSGEQVIAVNNEEQRIKLSGIVRPEDIGPDNTVSSTRIGSAHIELVGEGLLARKQRPGLISRLMRLFGW
jgi:flagellar L-ring protein precursor FlgH